MAVSKTVVGRKAHREFESLPLRFFSLCQKLLPLMGKVSGFVLKGNNGHGKGFILVLF